MFYENIDVPIRSSTKYSVILGLVLLLVGMGYSVYYKKASSPLVPEGTTSQQQSATRSAMPLTSAPKTKLPDASSPQSGWATVSIVGHGESFIPRPSGKHTLVAGRDIAAYAIYEGGYECSFKQQCPEGSLGTKVKNESAEERIASYAFAPD